MISLFPWKPQKKEYAIVKSGPTKMDLFLEGALSFVFKAVKAYATTLIITLFNASAEFFKKKVSAEDMKDFVPNLNNAPNPVSEQQRQQLFGQQTRPSYPMTGYPQSQPSSPFGAPQQPSTTFPGFNR